MIVAIYDPAPFGNEYNSKIFLAGLRAYVRDRSYTCTDIIDLKAVRNAHVVLLTDHLTEELIYILKEHGNKIIGINVTDSSYISGAIRYAPNLELVDLIFMVSGVQLKNSDTDFRVGDDFSIIPFEKPFLDEDTWSVFNSMRKLGKLQSLPYVPWTKIEVPTWTPWAKRSQKAILRGGGHSRRFLLALFLMLVDKLDGPNSGFVLFPYFAQGMNPQFRFCDDCRSDYEEHHRARHLPPDEHCNSPARASSDEPKFYDLHDLGQWNNRCPRSFFWMAEQFAKRYGSVDMKEIEGMLNAKWRHPTEHMTAMGRILFTSDLKWMHSIYQPQRYWEAAAAGCINVLPSRTMSQEYFPKTEPGVHYLVFEESFQNLDLAFSIGNGPYLEMAEANKELFDRWIQPGRYALNENLLGRMLQQMLMT